MPTFRQRISQSLSVLRGKEYKLGSPQQTVGVRYFEMQTPPGWGYQTYLKAYGEIGWLFAAVNVIAQAVSKTKWHLYELDKDGERTEITQHPIIDLFNRVNPYQSRYQFMYLGTMYKLLVGEEFWQLNFNGKGEPTEMWLAPPAFMSVVPSATEYIDHYIYKRDKYKINFSVDEIIHIKTPNPYDPYRGLSPAQALTVDLDSERYAARYNQKFFFNDASPGLILEFPPDQMPPAEVRKELAQEWDERFRGFRNRGNTAFLWGGKANTITMSSKDMDFINSRNFNRDAILGAYHIPRSVLGITENVNRANAEAGNYTFAQYCIDPELAELRECINKELVPFFGDNLYLDYENPIPEDSTLNVNNAVALFKGGIIKRNEARIYTDFEPLETPDGEEFFVQPSPAFGNPENIPSVVEPGKQVKALKSPLSDDSTKEKYWKDYVSRAESYEAKTIHELQTMYLAQKEEALSNLTSGKKNLIDLKASKKAYVEKMTPILTQVMSGSVKNGRELLEPENPHKAGEPLPMLPAVALAWLKTRIGWAADQIGEETASRLGQVLAQGYEQGLSTDQIAQNIQAEFDYFSDVRAQRIARTEIMQASATGALVGYKEVGVKQVEFYAAVDERTCPDCMVLHGQIFNIDNAEGVITVHPSCRCVFLAVTA